MSSPDLKITEVVEWLRSQALRYVLIAQDHAGRAELISAGTDKIPAQPKRGADLQRCAEEAKTLAQQFLGYATAVSALAPAHEGLVAGAATQLPATFLRRCSTEDYPGQAYFRLYGGDVVRAPLVSNPAPAPQAEAIDTAAPQRRSA
jgi:hypothetical protein